MAETAYHGSRSGRAATSAPEPPRPRASSAHHNFALSLPDNNRQDEPQQQQQRNRKAGGPPQQQQQRSKEAGVVHAAPSRPHTAPLRTMGGGPLVLNGMRLSQQLPGQQQQQQVVRTYGRASMYDREHSYLGAVRCGPPAQ